MENVTPFDPGIDTVDRQSAKAPRSIGSPDVRVYNCPFALESPEQHMASRPKIQCPLCNTELSPDTRLETHLIDHHSKRELVRFVVSEDEVLDETDASD